MNNCPPHHWQLDPKNYGVCACGEERQFTPPTVFPTLKYIPKKEAQEMKERLDSACQLAKEWRN